MRAYNVFLLLLLLMALCSMAQGEQCQDDDDCGEEECCVNYNIVSKRRIPGSDYNFYGQCESYGAEGQSCSGFYSCPCASGLICKRYYIGGGDPTTKRHAKRHAKRIIAPGDPNYEYRCSQANPPCTNNTDCAVNECCLTNYGIYSKKRILPIQPTCQPVPQAGEDCNSYTCPCAQGLTCINAPATSDPAGRPGPPGYCG